MLKDVMRKKLREQGNRVTAQREAILKIFEEVGDHLGAEDVYQLLLRRRRRISKATVYRTLELLTSMGLLRRLEPNEGVYRYELAESSSNHHHAICTSCGTIMNIDLKDLENSIQQAAESIGFNMTNYSVVIYGLCPSCQKKINAETEMISSK
ncbi:MAG: Fur family transcriptional regulator, ferric uptake regulator [Thermotogota bacterium]|nr:Fur family transcriptional regulator, ferric uptake regulator [Thermotogota bacterium]MDK2863951.1 Fur family transcriptional regulator, ferric uptake regulator [Thermotogota bacterium]HCZ05822.1 transcriptional repressor [Thermotogota bacterium]